MENGSLGSRMSCALGDTSLATIVGSPRACATLNRRGRMGGHRAGVSMLFCHEHLKAFTARSNGNDGTRHGIWLHDGPLPLELVLGHPGFRPRIAVMVQFSHQEGGL